MVEGLAIVASLRERMEGTVLNKGREKLRALEETPDRRDKVYMQQETKRGQPRRAFYKIDRIQTRGDGCVI